MQEAQPHQQVLFARIIFQTASNVEMILCGMGKVKFTINGKHVWGSKICAKACKILTIITAATITFVRHLILTMVFFFLFFFLNERDLITCYVIIF